jgi:type I restriction enzyme M protein
MRVEEFTECLTWWINRFENEHAWRVPIEQIAANNFNLDIKNPKALEGYEHLPPEQLAGDILEKERRISDLMIEIQVMIKRKVG